MNRAFNLLVVLALFLVLTGMSVHSHVITIEEAIEESQIKTTKGPRFTPSKPATKPATKLTMAPEKSAPAPAPKQAASNPRAPAPNPTAVKPGQQDARKAALASAAYATNNIFKNPKKAIEQRLEKLDKQHPSLGLKDYEVINAERKMYAVKDKKTNEVVVAFKGTNPLSPTDLGNDLLIAVGGKPARTNKAVNYTQNIIKSNPGSNVSVTGHSLGGTIAGEVAQKLNLKGTTFNPGSTPFKQKNIPIPDVKAYHIGGDLISANGVKGEKINLPRKNFIPLGNHGHKVFLDRYEKGMMPAKLLIL